MCAISGLIGLAYDKEILARMMASMRRRGPDDYGLYQDRQVALLHSRLAVIDPEGGKQPMELNWGGETYVLVYNGELYNTQELRGELIAAGHQFCGHSDTEVVLHAYAQYGTRCLELFNGIYAFVVWEQKSKRLFLARDRIGVKPLFYTICGEGFLFSSEIKTLLCHPIVKPRLDEAGAAQLLLMGPGRLPGSGVLCGIQEMEPGCCGYFENGKLAIHRYWKLQDREHQESFPETCDKVSWLVKDAIRRQMVSDVPIGTFLSGGLDSSIITAICAQEMAKRGEVLHTFSVDYQNNDRYFQSNKFQPDRDSAYIRLMQSKLSTNHHWTILTPEDLLQVLEEATIARDLPGMADVDFSLLAFCGDIRKKVTVALSGECADEIFGGYPWYRDPEIREKVGFPWAQNTDQRMALLLPDLGKKLSDFVPDAYSQTCRESDILPGAPDTERRMKEMVNLNFRWFMQTLLDRKDRMSMYNALEVRVPFCDYRIAEYLYGVPWEYKNYHGREKGLLRKAVEEILPKEILYRKKSPYPKTFDPSYEQAVTVRFQELLHSDSPLWHIVSRKNAEKLALQESPWPWYGQLMRRPQTLAYFLQLDFWLRHYNVEFCF